jgi:P4 family phage/plasmid primase-like protien
MSDAINDFLYGADPADGPGQSGTEAGAEQAVSEPEAPPAAVTLDDLSEVHLAELNGSCVDRNHIAARGYRTLSGTDDERAGLKEIRIPRWAHRDDSAYPGLLIPMYRVTGERIGYQWKPAVPQEAPGGKREKYASQAGTPNRLDVPPLCSDAVRDPSNPLWITEGVKKADCLASRGKAALTLTGVFNWRSKMGTLGDWEDIPIQGRDVVVCFDSDARDKRPVMMAMRRLGMWLESKGAQRVWYLIIPAEVGGVPVKGVDDYFAAGGTLEELGASSSRELPADGAKDAAFSDAVLADTVCSEDLDGRYRWASGLGWMTWTGKVWEPATDAAVTEAVRLWTLEQFNAVLDRQRVDPNRDMRSQMDGWRSVLSAGRLGSLVRLARGVLECKPDDFDADPDLLNCPNGILDLRSGTLQPHDPDQLMTRICGEDYVKGAQHPDWDLALTALPPEVADWYQLRAGQALTGYMTPDDIAIINWGGGSNGKTTIADALAGAAGKKKNGYHVVVSDRAMLGGASDNHPTEMMDFMGVRYAVLEETPESRRLDTNRLKKLTGTPQISARRIRQDSVVFEATHSLFVNTNYKPMVDETDHGTWRRLALVKYPFTYRKTAAEVLGPNDRLGDPTLRERCKEDPRVREAALAWMVVGAQRWYELNRIMPELPEQIVADTREWRMESDPILNFISDYLVFDHDRHVISPELREKFNAFLRDKGGHEWGDKTFLARFGGHDLCTQNNVERKRIRSRPGLSTTRPNSDPGVSYYAWLGVRFQTNEDGIGDPSEGGIDDSPFGNPGNPPGNSPESPQENPTAQDHVLPVPSAPVNESSPYTRGVNNSDGTDGTRSWNGPESDQGNEESMIETNDDGPPANPFEDEVPEVPSPVTVSAPEPEAPPVAAEAVQAPAPSPVDPLTEFDATAGPIGFDLEGADADKLFTYGPGFIRIGGLINAKGETATGKDIGALVAKLNEADAVYGHNILGFDGLALAYYHGLDWGAFCAKATDTDPLSRAAHPPRSRVHGSIDDYDLNHVAERYGVVGKTDNLARLKKIHGGYDQIPLDDHDYHAYLVGDVQASQHIRNVLPENDYTRREHKILAMMGRMTLNGFKVDRELLEQRYTEGQERKAAALEELHDTAGLPLGKMVMRGRGAAKREVFEPSKSPLATTEGNAWVKNLWQEHGVTRPPRTEQGHLSTKAEEMRKIASHPKCPPELAHLLSLMEIVTTTRTVYQTAKTYLSDDGRVHPVVSMRQASGRASVTKPGMTVYGKHAGKHVERAIFIPDDGHVLITCDASQVDMRAIAGHCQDPAYMALFEPGRDAHQEIADLLGISRQDAKARGHGWNYGLGANAMIRDGADPEIVYAFVNGMKERFPRLIEWREEVRERGGRGELLDNGFGRLMRCDPKQAYTVAPALMGQGGARDLVCDALLRLPEAYWPYLRTFVHDEIVMSVPEEQAEEIKTVVKAAFTTTWQNVPILADTTGPARDWGEASAK